MAEVAIARQMFQEICGSSRSYGRSSHQRQRRTSDGRAVKANTPEECVPMSGKIGQMRPSNAVRTVWDAEAIDTSHLGFRPIQKIATIHARQDSFGESRLRDTAVVGVGR